MYSRDGDQITITISADDFDRLLLTIGYFAGQEYRAGNRRQCKSWIQFADRLNEGNPNYVRYGFPETEDAMEREKAQSSGV